MLNMQLPEAATPAPPTTPKSGREGVTAKRPNAKRKVLAIDNSRFMQWLRMACTARGIHTWNQLVTLSEAKADEMEAEWDEATNGPFQRETLSGTSLTNFELNKRRVGADAARAIAVALDIDQVVVFKQAGIIKQPVTVSETAQMLERMLENVPPERRDDALVAVQSMLGHMGVPFRRKRKGQGA